MTGQTPVELWEPALARRSLPNGMPLTEPSRPEEATLLDAYAIKGLESGFNAIGWREHHDEAMFRTIELYPEDTPTLFVTPSTISARILAVYADIGSQIDFASQGISVRYVTSQESVAGSGSGGEPPVVVRESVERLRRQLGLNARVMASLIGLSKRRYYEFRAGDVLPEARLADIRDRVAMIERLVVRDLPAVVDLCRLHSTALADLLSSRRFAELEALFSTTVHSRATHLAADEAPRISAAEANELLTLVEAPAFRKLLRFVRFLAPALDNSTTERAGAALRMEKNIRAVEEGDPVEDEWEFLLVMQTDAIGGFRERADSFLRAEAFDSDTWAAFMTSESVRAWEAFNYKPADPPTADNQGEAVPPIVMTDGWLPDLAALGVDLSLYDRRTR